MFAKFLIAFYNFFVFFVFFLKNSTIIFILISNCIQSKSLYILIQLFIKIAIIQFVFKTKNIEVKIFSLEDIKILNSIKTIFFLIFLIFLTSFLSRLRFLRLLFFVLFFVAFLIFVFFFVAFLSNLFLKNTLFFLLLLDFYLKTRFLKKIANFVDLLTTILSLFLTKILYLSLTRCKLLIN